MVSIVSGNTLGISLTTLATLGQRGVAGSAGGGRNGESAYVNIANGNLVLQDRDDLLVARGADVNALRTYNSQGLLTDENADNWSHGIFIAQLLRTVGSNNAPGSVLRRTDRDGAQVDYNFDTASGTYVATAGGGAHDRITYDAGSTHFTWTDGDTGTQERYDANGVLVSITDTSGNSVQFTSANWRLLSMRSASGETTHLDYSGNNITQVRTVRADGSSLIRTRYSYDASNRLSTVTVDLTPEDNSIADGRVYTTTYTYDGTSRRVASATQTDGSRLTITYVEIGGNHRVETVTDALGQLTRFTYDTANRRTTVTDPMGQSSVYEHDVAGQLTRITAPAVAGVSQVTQFTYNANGDLIQVVDPEGRAVQMEYDARGNQTLQRDAAGNTVTRTFDVRNQVVTETAYLVPDPDGAGAAAASTPITDRYVYDSSNRNLLRFSLSAEGRVTEHQYDSAGQRTATISYTGAVYAVGGLGQASVPSETDMIGWTNSQDRTQTQRVDTAYDFRGQVQRTTSYASTASNGLGVADATVSTTQYVYDQAGQLLRTLSPNGTTTFVYDGLGRVLASTNAAGETTTHTYDDAHNRTSVTAANGLITTSTYDRAGRLVSVGQETPATQAAQVAASRDDFISPTGLVSADSFGKTSGSNEWSAGFRSREGFTGGAAVSFSPAQTDRHIMVGLNSDPAADNGYSSIDYAFYVHPNGALIIYEGGTHVGPAGNYEAGDTLTVVYDGANVRYLRNGTVLRTVAAQISAPLYADSSFHDVGGYVTDIQFGQPAFIASSQMFVTNNSAEKISGGSDWSAGFRGRQGYEGHASVTFQALRTDVNLMVGLNSDPASNDSYGSIDFALYVIPGGRLQIYESGNFIQEVSGYAAGDDLQVAYDGSHIHYLRNGVALYSRAVSVQGPLFVDSSFHEVGARVGNIRVSGGTPGSAAANPTDGSWLAASTGMSINAGHVVKTSGTHDWNAGVRSRQGYTGGAAVSFAPARTDGHLMVGLNSDPSSDNSYGSIDYAWYCIAGGYLQIYESGGFAGSFGTYAAGDKLEVVYDGGFVRYLSNGQVLRSVAASVSQPLYADSSFVEVGAEIHSLQFTQPGFVTSANMNPVGSQAAAANDTPLLVGSPQMALAGGHAEKISGPHDWSAGFRSTSGFTGGASVSFQPSQNAYLMVGLTADPGADNYYASIDYAFYCRPDGSLAVYENGTHGQELGSYSAGDTLEVVYDGAQIRYLRNGVDLRSVVMDIRHPLYADSSFVTVGSRASNIRFEQPSWINSTHVVLHEGTAQKTGGVSSWDAGFRSREGYVGGASVSFSPAQTDKHLMLGLNSDPGSNHSYASIDFAMYVIAGGWLHICENGISAGSFGTYAAGDKLEVVYDGSAVRYLRNGEVLRSVIGPITEPLYADSSFHEVGTKVTNLSFTQPQLLSSGDVVAVDGTATRVSGSSAWNAGSRSRDGLVGGAAVSFSPAQNDKHLMIGLNSDPASDNNYASIDYAFYVHPSGALLAYESGVSLGYIGGYNVGDILTVVYDGTSVRYLRNGTVLRSVTANIPHALYLDSSFHDVGSRITSLHFGKPETRYVYDTANRLRMTQDPTGVRNWFLYDEADRKVADIDADGSLVEYVYNRNNQVTQAIAYTTRVSVTGLMDGNGNPLNVTLASVNPGGARTTTWNLYDNANRLAKTIDALGNVVETRYDGAARVTDVIRWANPVTASGITATTRPTDAAATPVAHGTDRRTRNLYSADGLLAGALDADGYLTELGYDAAGRLATSVKYATASPSAHWVSGTLAQLHPGASVQDQRSVTLYNARGQVIGQVDAENYLTELSYDPSGNVTRTVRYATAVASYVNPWTLLGNIRPAVSAADQASTAAYDALSRLVRQTDAEGTVTEQHYDAVGNLVASTRAAGTAETRTTAARYDAQGRLVGELSAEGAALLTGSLSPAQIDAIWAQHGLSHAYDAAGRRTSTTDALGAKTLFFYNVDGQLIHTVNALGEAEERTYNALNQLVTSTRFGTRISTVGLNGGLVTGTLTTALNAVRNASRDSTTRLTYTARGQVETTTDALGHLTTQLYNAFGENSRTTVTTEPGQTRTDITDYDRRGLYSSSQSDWYGLNIAASVQRDAFGRVVSEMDGNRVNRYTSYDRLGREVQTTDRMSRSRSATWDAFGRVLTQTDALSQATTYTYSNSARSSTVTTPEGVAVTSVHTRHGQTLSVTDGRGSVTSYTYDRNGNLKTATDALGNVTRSDHDRANRLIGSTDATGVLTTLIYDATHRVLTRRVDPTGLNLVTRYEYDAKGQQTRVTDPAGSVTETRYDLKGQVLTQIVDPLGLNLTTSYTYDARGKTLTVNDKGTVTRYTYDKLGRRTHEQVDPSGLNLTTRYEYDANGNVKLRIDGTGAATRYAYDSNDRVVYEVDGTGGVGKTDYDADGRVTKTTRYATPITLAGLPDIATLSQIQARIAPNAGDQVQFKRYDRDGRVRFTVSGTGGVSELRYDASGNVVMRVEYANAINLAGWSGNADPQVTPDLARDQVTRAVYDAAGRQTYSVDAVGSVTQYEYDAAGRVVAKRELASQVPTGGAIKIKNADNQWHAIAKHFGTFRAGDTVTATIRFKAPVGLRGEMFLGDASGPDPYDNCVGTSTMGDDGWQTITLTRTMSHDDVMSVYIYNMIGSSDPNAGVVYDNLTVTSTLQGNVLVEDFQGFDPEVRGWSVGATTELVQANLSQVGSHSQLAAFLPTLLDAGKDRVTRYTYDAAGRQVYAVDATGTVTETQYDAAGPAIKTVQYANTLSSGSGMRVWHRAGLNSSASQPLGSFKAGDVVTATVRFKAPANTAGLVFLGDAGGPHPYNNFRQSPVTYGSDGWQIITVTHTMGSDDEMWLYVYGDSGNPQANNTHSVLYDNVRVSSVQRGDVLLDNFDTIAWATDSSQSNRWNVSGFAERELTPASSLTLSQLQPLITALADSTRDRVTRSVYDGAGRQTYSVDAVGSVTQYEYDATGRVVTKRELANAVPTGDGIKIKNADSQWHAIAKHFGTFRAGDTVTATIRFKAPVGLRGEMFLGDASGPDPYDNCVGTSTMGDDGWQTITLTRTMSHDDVMSVYIYNMIGSSDPNAGVVYDNLTVTSTLQGNVLVEDFQGFDPVVKGWSVGATTELVQVNLSQMGSHSQLAAFLPTLLDAGKDRVTRYTYDAAGRQRFTIDAEGYVSENEYDAYGQVIRTLRYERRPSLGAQPTEAQLVAATQHFNTEFSSGLGSFYGGGGTAENGQLRLSSRPIAGGSWDGIYSSNTLLPGSSVQFDITPTTPQQTLHVGLESQGGPVFSRLMAVLYPDGRVYAQTYGIKGNGRQFDLGTYTVGVTYTMEFVTEGSGGTLYFYAKGSSRSGGQSFTTTDDFAWTSLRTTFYVNRYPSLAGETTALIDNIVEAHAPAQVTSYTYDGAGRVRSTTDAERNTETYTYNAFGDKVTFTNKKNSTWTYGYDAASRLVSETSPEVEISRVRVDAGPDDVVFDESRNRAITTRLAYDAFGNLLSRTEAAGLADERTTRYAYDALGRQVRVTYPTFGIYNEALTAVTANGAVGQGQAQRREDTREVFTQTFYDAFGNAVANVDVAGSASYKAYDALGRVVYDIDAEGYVTHHQRDAFGNDLAVTRYNNKAALPGAVPTSAAQAFNLAQVRAALSTHALDRRLETDYDRLGRAVQVREPLVFTYDSSLTGGQTNPQASGYNRKTTANTFDAFGQLVQMAEKTATGWAYTQFHYDALGHRVASVDAMGHVTRQSFDAAGNLVSLTEYANRVSAPLDGSWRNTAPAPTLAAANATTLASFDRRVDFEYDRLNRKTRETRRGVLVSDSAPGQTTGSSSVQDSATEYAYDAVGNLTRTKDALQGETWSHYDALGRVLAVSAPTRRGGDGSTLVTPLTVFKRDAYGNVVQQTEAANGAAVSNASGFNWTVNTLNDRVTHTLYDKQGHATQTTDALGASSYLSYNARGQVAKSWQPVQGKFGYSDWWTGVTTYYDGQSGTVSQVVQYDKLGQVINTVEPGSTQALRLGIKAVRETSASATITEGWGSGQTWREYVSYSGSNVVDLQWAGIVNPAGGAVSVRLTYRSAQTLTSTGGWQPDYTLGAGASGNVYTYSLSAGDAIAGMRLNWTNNIVGPIGIDAIESITVTQDGLPIWNGSGHEATGSTVTTAAAALTQTQMAYNAFGEVTSKGVNGGAQEQFAYDNAGRLWRTNTGDGVYRINLFDMQGRQTADLRNTVQTGTKVEWQTNAQEAAGNTSLRRTETRYDALGRAVAQVLPIASPNNASVNVRNLSVGMGVGTSGTPTVYPSYDYSPGFMEWTGSNRINLSWSDLSALGNGDMRVTAHYVTTGYEVTPGYWTTGNEFEASYWVPGQYQPGAARDITRNFTAAEAATGASLSWTDPGGYQNIGSYGGLSAVNRVVVQKKNASGEWVTVINHPTTTLNNRVLEIPVPQDGADGVLSVERRPVGGGASSGTPLAFTDFGRLLRVDVTNLSGNYDYVVHRTLPNQTPVAIAQGSFNPGSSASGANAATPVPTITQELDRWGNVLSVNDARNAAWKTTSAYNADNKLLRETRPQANGSANGPTAYNHYDKLGRQIGARDANGNLNGQVYDASGNLVHERHADGGVITHTYDALGNKVRTIDAEGNHNLSKREANTTRYEYDRLGRLTYTRHGTANNTVNVWSISNTLQTSSVVAGTYESNLYDDLGRKIQTTKGASNSQGISIAAESATYTYDLAGRVVQTLQNGQTTRTLYDAYGRKSAEVDANGIAMTWETDYFGRTRKHTDLGGARIVYNVDDYTGLTTSITNSRHGTGAYQTFQYDTKGQLLVVYDASLVRWTSYVYDAVGNHVREKTVQRTSRPDNSTYDEVYQDNLMAYDALGRLRHVSDGRMYIDMTYDAAGNRMRIQTGVSIAANNTVSTDTSFQRDRHFKYDEMNRQIVVDAVNANGDISWMADPTAPTDDSKRIALGHILTYDKNGNRTSDTYYGNQVTQSGGYTYLQGYRVVEGVDEYGFPIYRWNESYTGSLIIAPNDYRLITLHGRLVFDTGSRDEAGNIYYREVDAYTADVPLEFTRHHGITQESYTYDALNRLKEVKRGSASLTRLNDGDNLWDGVVDMPTQRVVDSRRYDAMGRLIESGPGNLNASYAARLNEGVPSGQTIGLENHRYRYDTNSATNTGRMLSHHTYNATGQSLVNETIDHTYDAAGNQLSYRVHVPNVYVNTYRSTLKRFEGYKEVRIDGTSTRDHPGTSNLSYDASGNLIAVDDLTDNSRDRTFVNDQSGRALFVNQSGNVQRQVTVNGDTLGRYGMQLNEQRNGWVAVADFNFNYQKITGSHPNASVGSYTVRSGENLRAIARSAYGDEKLWWQIAEANGLTGDRDMRVGQTLSIPSTVGTVHNNANTFKAYDPSKITGDTTPNMPTPPPPKKGCGALAMIIVIVVAVVATIFTAGAAAPMLGMATSAAGTFATGLSVLAGTATVATTAGVAIAGTVAATSLAAATVMAGAIAGAVGSIASQLVGKALGTQEHFSWKGVAMGAIGSAVTAGLGNVATGALAGSGTTAVVARAAIGNAVTQGIGVATGLQEKFSWKGVAASAVAAYVGKQLGDAMAPKVGAKAFDLLGDVGGQLARDTVKGFVSGVAAAVTRGGKVDVRQIATDAFGNALATAVVDTLKPSAGVQAQRSRQIAVLQDAATKSAELVPKVEQMIEEVQAGKHDIRIKSKNLGPDINARYDRGETGGGEALIHQSLVAGANNAEGAARLLAAIYEETAEWAIRKLGIGSEHLGERSDRDAGAILGKSTFERMVGASDGRVSFDVDIDGTSKSYSTDSLKMKSIISTVFSEARIAANVGNASTGYQMEQIGFPIVADLMKAKPSQEMINELLKKGGFTQMTYQGVDKDNKPVDRVATVSKEQRKIILVQRHEQELFVNSLLEKPVSGYLMLIAHSNEQKIGSMYGPAASNLIRNSGAWEAGMPIMLDACSSGKVDGGISSSIAGNLKTYVTAPTELSWNYPWWMGYGAIGQGSFPKLVGSLPNVASPGTWSTYGPDGRRTATSEASPRGSGKN